MVDEHRRREAFILMGEAMDAAMMLRDYDRAVNLFTRAIQLDPRNAEIYHNRGMAYAYLRRWREAIDDFTRALQYEPHPSSYEQRGNVYGSMGDKRAARQDWEHALRMDARRVLPLLNLGWLAFEERNLNEALDYLNRALQVEPTMAQAYLHRAKVYYEMGDQARTFSDLQHAKELIESGADTSEQDLFN